MPRTSRNGVWKVAAAFFAGVIVASWGPLYAQGISYRIVKASSVKPLVKSSLGCGLKTGIWLDFDDVLQIEYRNNTYLLNTNSGEGCKV